MNYTTYIIESENTGMLYIGQTEDLERRWHRHNNGGSKFTKGKGPWKLLYFIEFKSRSDAVLLERKLKKFKNPNKVREWIKNHKVAS